MTIEREEKTIRDMIEICKNFLNKSIELKHSQDEIEFNNECLDYWYEEYKKFNRRKNGTLQEV